MQKVILFHFLFFALCKSTLAQTEGQEILSGFSIYQQGDEIRIQVTIEAGTSSCLGIDLERKIGEGEFEIIDNIPDINPLSGKELSYRLNLGNVGRSEVLSIYYVVLENGISIYPNPAIDVIQVMLDKPYGIECDVEVSNSQGHIVFSLEKWIQPSFAISCSHWQNGIYTVKVRSEQTEWVKQFILL
jgi:hypothetical protein